jgi:hypothetical protein
MYKSFRRPLVATALGAAVVVAAASGAGAQGLSHAAVPRATENGVGFPGPSTGPANSHAVFVQTDSLTGNAIEVLSQHADGRLSVRDVVPTGGLGAQAVGSAADHLASQGSLQYDPVHQLLFAVNAGSGTVSVFDVAGRNLRLAQVVSSGGEFPDSIAVRGNLVYVLNSGGAGEVQGYGILGDHLVPLPGASASLGLNNTNPPFFLDGAGQVGISPDGSQLLVTTKASTSSVEIFGIGHLGQLSPTPKVTADGSNVPFAFVFSPLGQLVVAEAGPSALHTFTLGPNGSLASLSTSVGDNQTALCWVASARGYYFVANAGSANISAYSVATNGAPSLVGTTGVVATTDAGPVDLAASSTGADLYVEAGVAGAVDEFAVNPDGSLTDLGSVADLGPGIEGIATD